MARTIYIYTYTHTHTHAYNQSYPTAVKFYVYILPTYLIVIYLTQLSNFFYLYLLSIFTVVF